MSDSSPTPQAESPSPETGQASSPAGFAVGKAGGRTLVTLAVLYTLYFASSLLIPLVVALFFSLLLSPAVRRLKRLHIPRGLSAIVIIAVLVAPFSLLAVELTEPAQKWIKLLPEISQKITTELEPIEKALSKTPTAPVPQPEEKQGWFASLFGGADDRADDTAPAPAPSKSVINEQITKNSMEALASGLYQAPTLIFQILTTLILTLFLLSFGPRIYHATIHCVPWLNERRETCYHFMATVQGQLSRYIASITLINLTLGLLLGLGLWLAGFEDPELWAALAVLLNFAPYVGPVIMVIVLALSAMVQFGVTYSVLYPLAIYLSLNILESQLITPICLGHNLRLNPLIVLVWLILMGWLWGFAGVLLAVPLLVLLKLAMAQLECYPWVPRLIETPAFSPVNPSD